MANEVAERTRARAPGRPRDASIDERVTAATRALLAEQGFDATTVQAIAARAGVHSSAIYRRWPSRIELIEAAVSPAADLARFQPTGDLRRDLRRFMRAYVAMFAEPAAQAAVRPLLVHYQTSGADRDASGFLNISTRPQFAAILRAAAPRSVDPAVNPDDVFDMLLGSLLARSLVPTVANRRRPLERLVDLIVRAVEPRKRAANVGNPVRS
jgi:AcrR family transcriptional regulator